MAGGAWGLRDSEDRAYWAAGNAGSRSPGGQSLPVGGMEARPYRADVWELPSPDIWPHVRG